MLDLTLVYPGGRSGGPLVSDGDPLWNSPKFVQTSNNTLKRIHGILQLLPSHFDPLISLILLVDGRYSQRAEVKSSSAKKLDPADPRRDEAMVPGALFYKSSFSWIFLVFRNSGQSV